MSDVTYAYSAGGVVLDRGRVLMIRTRTRRGRSVWTFPKGRLEPGETQEEAALREVREETGYQCETVGSLSATTFWFREKGQRVRKTVHWFLLRPRPHQRAGSFSRQEVEEVRWVPLREAYTKLSYASDRKLLTRAENIRRKTTQKP